MKFTTIRVGAQGAAAALIVMGFAITAQAASHAAMPAAAEACSACHGANGISVDLKIPNLAGQKQAYLTAQLNAFRSKTRKNDLMNAIAEQLSDEDIAAVAGHFSALPGGDGKAKSEFVAAINKTRVTFPGDYKTAYTKYTTISFPKRKQVRYYYANKIAADAAKAGQPMPNGAKFFVEVFKVKLDGNKMPMKGADGHLLPDGDKPAFFTAMETQDGWGKDIPDILRNGDWNYAVFTGKGELRTNVNQAGCLACHKPLDNVSYVFSLDKLKDKAMMK